MLILHLNVNMKLIILHIKSSLRNSPAISGKIKNILMEISYFIGVRFINLAETLIRNRLLNCFAINL